MDEPSQRCIRGLRGPGRHVRTLMLALVLAAGVAALAACRPDPAEGAAAGDAVAATEQTQNEVDAGAADPDRQDRGASAETQEGASFADERGTADTDPVGGEGEGAPGGVGDGPAPSVAEDEPEGSDSSEAPAPADAAGDLAEPDGPYDVVSPLVDAPRTTFDAPEDVLDAGADYLARIVTSKGTMIVDLYEDRVPNTVNNFVFLALHRFYEGVPFHRVLEDFMAQTGDPTGTGQGGPGYRFEDEIDPELTHDAKGVLSMANAGPNTNGSQFFITFTATPWLDGNHAVFGQVIEGLDVLDAITRVSPDEPAAVAMLDDSVASVVAQGVTLGGPEEQSVGERLADALGTSPVVGQSFTVDGYRGVVGRVGDQPAVGFFVRPDVIERVDVLTRSSADQ